MKKLIIGLSILAVILLSTLAIYTDKDSTGTYNEYNPNQEIITRQFTSEEELLKFIKDNPTNDYSYMRALGGDSLAEDIAAPTDKTTDYSETNVQVQGIDEADIIKTDGDYIYTITGNTLFIIKAYPGEEAEIISEVDFDDNPSSLFISGNSLAIFGNEQGKDYSHLDFVPNSGMSYFHIYDISDKENPTLEKEYTFEGRYFRGRMQGDYIYYITTTTPRYYLDHPTPVLIEDGVLKDSPIEEINYFNIDYNSPMFVNIHSINIKDQDVNSMSLVVESSQDMYMSEENIYLTYTERIREYDLQRQVTIDLLEDSLNKEEKDLVGRIKSTDNDILSKSEKDQKIWVVYQKHISNLPDQEEIQDELEILLQKKIEELKHLEHTIIHRLEVDDEDVTPKSNGRVPGRINNQFSMDEHENVLRIATTISGRWSMFDEERTESTNNVYTLNQDLKILDKIEGIAKGESIFSTRFVEDRLYMVTFRQIDPFFVIDLSNPNNIKELGELKIPGFSRYLHPYDDDTIMGLGQEDGKLKISLFDVSNVEKPIEIAKYTTEDYAGSTALFEHKAFLFSKEKNLLVIPVYSYNYQNTEDNYNGAFVFDITKDSIELRGLIDHGGEDYYYRASVERSLYIEEYLYTKSRDLLRINLLEDLSSVKDIELTGEEFPIF